MRIFATKLFWIIILLTIVSCSKKEEPVQVTSNRTLKQVSEAPDKSKIAVNEPKIIKEGEIIFETADLTETKKMIDAAIQKYGGYISNENSYRYEDKIQETAEIRVPAENFEKLVAEISKSVSKFDQKVIKSKDVGEEYVDIEIRIKIKKETENRYRALLAQAKKVEEILEIEKQIGILRAEIESAEGRLRYLQNRISHSKLTATFYQRISTPVGFSLKFKLGLKNGWNNFVWFLIGMVNIWPFIVAFVIAAFFCRAYRKRKKARGVFLEGQKKDKP